MVYNKIYAQIWEERHITLDPINYQYDVKQILVISGETVPEYYEADICNVGDTATLTMIGTAADGVEIPDRFLLDGRNVLVYVVIPGSGGDVQTRYDITIPVDERAERTDIELDTDQQTQADSLIAALNSGVGRAEAAVTHYPKIVDGYWYVWNAETETWVNTEIRAEGRDGYSPEVTITEIEGGHRVTITDEDHPQGQTFDVMDGQGGSTGDYDELTNRPRINGHTLTGNQSAPDLGLGTYSKPASGIPKTDLAQDVQASLGKADTALQTAPVTSVNSKTGAVTLGAGDIGYDGTETYQNGTAGAALSELNRQLSDLEDTVSTTQIINTASGSIASFSDGADSMPINKLVAQIEPVQDLHGYDHPWPAGGGKNRLSIDPSIVTVTQDGVTFTINRNSDGDVTSIVANGTATQRCYFSLGRYNIKGGTILNGAPSGGSQNSYSLAIDGTSIADYGNGSSIADDLTNGWLMIVIANGFVCNNLTFKPMIRLATETDATFAPYSNLCPISGHTGADVMRTGVNVLDEETELGYWNVRDGSTSSSTSELRSKNFIPVTPNTQYYFNKSTDNRGDVLFFGKDQEYLHDYVPSVANRTFTTPDNCYYIKINFGNQYGAIYNHDVSINYPATDTEYHPYTGNQISVTFPSEAGTVYGGTLTLNPDGTGTLVADMVMLDLGTLTWTKDNDIKVFYASYTVNVDKFSDRGYQYVSSEWTYGESANNIWSGGKTGLTVEPSAISSQPRIYAKNPIYDNLTAVEFKQAMSGVQVVHELQSPVTYALTGEQVSGILTTLYGTNNIWSSTGDTSVEYCADTKLYIDNKITQAIANALNS